MLKETFRSERIDWSFTNTNEPFFNSSDYNHIRWKDTRDGVSVPRWRGTLKAKGNATSPLTGVKNDIKYDNSSVIYTSFLRDGKTHTATLKGIPFLPGFLGRPDTSGDKEAYNAALGSYYSSISEAYSQFQGGSFLGELAETLSLVTNPTKGIHKIASAYLGNAKKLTRYKRLEDRIDALREMYLEVQFGWKPLISDVSDAIAAVERLKARVPSVRVHGYGKYVHNTQTVTDNPSFNSAFNLIRTTKYEQKTEVILTGSVSLDAKSGLTARSQFGLTTEQFIPTLWNLLPYSFVADYFSNIGDVLNAHAYSNIRPTFNCCTYRRVGSIECTVRNEEPNVDELAGYGGSYSWTSTSTDISRNVFVPSVPSLQLNKPSGVQGLNLVALAPIGKLVSNLLTSI